MGFRREVTVDGEEEAAPRRCVPERLAKRLALTLRQAEVVYCVAHDGLTDQETARALRLSARTIRGHLTRVQKKLDVSRILLARRVLQELRGRLGRRVLQKDGRLRLSVLEVRLGLSPQLASVARLIWEDRSSKQIARELSLSVHTAANYRRRLRDVLGAHSAVTIVRRIHEALTREESSRR